MATIDVLDATSATVAIEKPLAPGAAAASASRPVTLSTENVAVLGATNESAPGTDTAASGLNGRLQRIAQNITSAITHLSTLAGAIASSRMAVNPISGQAGVAAGSGSASATTQRVLLATDDPVAAVITGISPTCTTSITRPSDSTDYAAGDAIAASTPAVGGQTWSNAARASGKTVILTDLIVTSSAVAATPLSGEVWIFDSSVTAVADNAALAFSDAEAQTLVGIVPFSLALGVNNSHCHVQNLNIVITTVGSADLRFLVKATNAYDPTSGEVLTFRAKFMPVN